MPQVSNAAVEAVSRKFPGRVSLKIGADWYGLVGDTHADKGSVVSFDYLTNAKGYKDIVKGTLTIEGGSSAPAPAAKSYPSRGGSDDKERQKQIMRQSAAKITSELLAAGKLDAQSLQAVAESSERLAQYFAGEITPEQLGEF